MKRWLALSLVLACGDGKAGRASRDFSIELASGNVVPLVGRAFSFPVGVPEAGVSGATTVTFGTTDSPAQVTLTASGLGYRAAIAFGPCALRVSLCAPACPNAFDPGTFVPLAGCTVSGTDDGAAVHVALTLGRSRSTPLDAPDLTATCDAAGACALGPR